MTVSIIIPTYNQGKYLGRCIHSAINQTYRDIEVIVVDDGSTDNTLDVETGFDNINVFIKPNGGTASALNYGIKEARGDWIHWLSSDDILTPDAIETMMRYECGKDKIYYTDYLVIDENDDIVKEFREPNRSNLTFEQRKKELFQNFYGNGSTTLIHKSVFKKIGYFDEKLPYFEDYDFWLRAMTNGIDLFHIPKITLCYRNHPEQMTNRIDLKWNEIIRERYRNETVVV